MGQVPEGEGQFRIPVQTANPFATTKHQSVRDCITHVAVSSCGAVLSQKWGERPRTLLIYFFCLVTGVPVYNQGSTKSLHTELTC